MNKPPVCSKKRTAYRAIRVCLLLLAAALYGISVYIHFWNIRVQQRAVYVDAEIIYIRDYTEGDDRRNQVYAEYFYDGDLYGILYDEDRFDTYTVGEPISVRLDPLSPEKALEDTDVTPAVILCGLGGAAALAVCLGIHERKIRPDYCTAFRITRTYIHADALCKLRYDRVWLMSWSLTLSTAGLCWLCSEERLAFWALAAVAGAFLVLAVAETWKHCKIAGSVKHKRYAVEKIDITAKTEQNRVLVCGSTDSVCVVCGSPEAYEATEVGDELQLLRLDYKNRPYLAIAVKDRTVFYRVSANNGKKEKTHNG